MPGAFSEMDLRVLDEPEMFLVISDVMYNDGTFSYLVPKGFRTDLASVPFYLRPVFSRTGPNRKPAVFHDHMYSRKWRTRKLCDYVFKKMLKDQGVSAWKCWLYYAGVRCFGWTRGSW